MDPKTGTSILLGVGSNVKLTIDPLTGQAVPLPSAPNGAQAPDGAPQPIKIDIQISQLDVGELVVLFDGEVITDTVERRPKELVDMRNTPPGAILFEVDNRLDQSIDVQIIGSLRADPQNAGNLGLGATIAATTREPVATEFWAPFMGLTITATAAPTAGSVRVEAQALVEKRIA